MSRVRYKLGGVAVSVLGGMLAGEEDQQTGKDA